MTSNYPAIGRVLVERPVHPGRLSLLDPTGRETTDCCRKAAWLLTLAVDQGRLDGWGYCDVNTDGRRDWADKPAYFVVSADGQARLRLETCQEVVRAYDTDQSTQLEGSE